MLSKLKKNQSAGKSCGKLIARCLCACMILILGLGAKTSSVQALTVPLSYLQQGQVIQIAPKTGTYMCGAQTCTSNGAAAEPYKLMATGLVDNNGTGDPSDDAAYFVMLDNYCAWRSADCNAYNGAKYWYGTSWNGDGENDLSGSTTGYNNDLGGSRKSRNILIQLNNFYNTLPDTIAGNVKSSVIPTKSFDITPVIRSSGGGTSTYDTTCRTTTTTTPYGNIAAIFNGANCTWISKVSLLSYDEWQGTSGFLPWALGHYPESGTIGSAFCLARFGTANCNGTGNTAGLAQYSLFIQSSTTKMPYSPWTRTPYGGNVSGSPVWFIGANSAANSMYYNTANSSFGVLPALWLSSEICASNTKTGNYTDPFLLSECELTSTMILSLSSTTWNVGTKVLTVSGSVEVETVNQTMTVWADACNTQGDCVRKEVRLNSGSSAAAQNFTLTWNSGELPPGQYSGTVWVGAQAGELYDSAQSDEVNFVIDGAASGTLAALHQGDVIQIPPRLDETTPTNNYMCSNQNCSDNGTPAEPYKLMYTGTKDQNSSYFVMLDNYCAWRSADCTYAYNTSNTKYWYGSSWNSNYGNTTSSNDLGGSRQAQNILIQLNNFYNTLPDTIAGTAKSLIIPTKSFDMTPVNTASSTITSTGTSTYNTCQTTTNTTPYGNINATFSSSPCAWTSKVSLLSYDEWQGTSGSLPWAYGHYPTSGTIGSTFCLARFGTADCSNAAAYNLFVSTSGTFKAPYRPWMRTSSGGSATTVWAVLAFSATGSMSDYNANTGYGVLPALWLSSSIERICGSGTYDSPYHLVGDPCADFNISVTETDYDDQAGTLTISGQVQHSLPDQNMTVWASVCNTAGECVRKEVTVNSGADTGGDSAAAQPYSLVWPLAELPAGTYSGTVWINAHSQDSLITATQSDPLNFSLNPAFTLAAAASRDDSSGVLTVGGNVTLLTSDSKTITIWANACNSQGECIQKQTTIDSGTSGSNLPYGLSWSASELPAGTYSGNIWVYATAGEHQQGAASNPLTFTVNPRLLEVTVVQNQPFALQLGSAVNLTPGTSEGITVVQDTITDFYTISGSLNLDKIATFGSTIIDFKVIPPPQPGVTNLNLR